MSDSKPRYFAPAAGEGGMTELHRAACRGDFNAVVAAVQERCDVNAPDHGGWTALHWLVDMGMVEGERERILDALLAAGADLEARDLEGSTPLMVACRAGNPDLVRRLVDAGATVNAHNLEGRTALMEAASYGEPQTMRLLLARGAQRSARTRDGKAAVDFARAQGWDEVVAILRQTK